MVVPLLLVFALGCGSNKLEKKVISTSDAPKAIGPYSQAIQVGNMLYLAGQIAIDPITGNMADEDVQAQTQQCMKNINAVLNAAGFSFTDVVQCQIFLTDLNNYSTVNQIYAEYFKEAPPARAVVEVKRLPKDALIEIMIVAVKS
ncbi:MAG: hypothetical protein A2V66_06905 [Ignavibacteria bacterium RBG_13_36_8]|nr:MAG: hypothetical protein A2V66_06905 [Ignavibacteria bacterium RBG_13_36_8]